MTYGRREGAAARKRGIVPMTVPTKRRRQIIGLFVAVFGIWIFCGFFFGALPPSPRQDSYNGL